MFICKGMNKYIHFDNGGVEVFPNWVLWVVNFQGQRGEEVRAYQGWGVEIFLDFYFGGGLGI